MGQLSLILRDYVPKLGEAGDLVRVKPGYARNYLLPRGLASVATDSRVKELEHHQRAIADKQAKELKATQSVADRLKGVTVETAVQAGETGKLFGSVTNAAVAELLAEQGFKVDRRRVLLVEPIKQVGEYEVPVKLHRDLTSSVKVIVKSAGAPVEQVSTEPDLTGVEHDEDVPLGQYDDEL